MLAKLFFLPLLLVGSIFTANSQTKKVVDSLQSLLLVAKHDSSKISLLNKLANAYLFDKPDTAIQLSKQALILAQKTADNKAQGFAYNTIAVVYMRRSMPEAETYFYKSLEMRQKVKDRVGVCASYSNLCAFYTEQANYSKALEVAFLALRIQDTLKNDKYISKIFINIGNVYLQQNQYEQAEKYFKNAEKINEKVGDKSSASAIYVNLGYICEHRIPHQHKQALIYYQKALFLSKTIQHRFRIADILGNIGNIYQADAKYDSALYYHFASVKMHEEIGDLYNRSRNLSNIAKVKLLQGKPNEAIKFAEQAIEKAKASQNKETEVIASKLLTKIYKQKGNFEKALYYHEISEQVNDSIFNAEQTKTLKNLQHQYEIEKHQTQIALLHKDKIIQNDTIALQNIQQNIRQNILLTLILMAILVALFFYWSNKKRKRKNELLHIQNIEINQQKEEIQAQAEALDTLNHTKDKLFTIIAHDLRSPLYNLKTLLQLFEKQFITPDEFTKYMKDLRTNVDTIKDTLDNLLNWSVSQLQGLQANPESLNMHDLTTEIISLYQEIADKKEITLSNQVSETTFVRADKNHIRLVLRNLLSNAIKFTNHFGEVKFTANKYADTFIEISVIDNGIGMEEKQAQKLFKTKTYFTSYGTDQEKGTGVGLALCEEFVHKNGGKIRVESKVGQGTSFLLLLPIAEKI